MHACDTCVASSNWIFILPRVRRGWWKSLTQFRICTIIDSGIHVISINMLSFIFVLCLIFLPVQVNQSSVHIVACRSIHFEISSFNHFIDISWARTSLDDCLNYFTTGYPFDSRIARHDMIVTITLTWIWKLKHVAWSHHSSCIVL